MRTTTRAFNPAWYQDALELDLQLHIRTDGASIVTFYHDRKQAQWSAGPVFSEEILHDPVRLEALIEDAVRYARENDSHSLGVVLHIADEFATTELKPELNNPAALAELRDAALGDPSLILEDSSIMVDQASWRVLPYPAANSEVIGTAITVTRHYAPLIEMVRLVRAAENFPIITHALSAPLVAIMGLSQSLKPTPGKPFVAILQYPWFTALAYFNEHADLRLIRTLQHRGLRRPSNFRNALTTTSASLEFVDPDLFVIPLGANVDVTLCADLKLAFPGSRVEMIEQTVIEGIPVWCPEPAISVLADATVLAKAVSHTFLILREEKWALQDFLPIAKEVVEIYPSRWEMKLLRGVRLARIGVFAIASVFVAYYGFGVIDLMSRREWKFDPAQAQAIQGKLAKLTTERQKANHWNNLLDDRSKAWVSMESLSRMFPEKGGMLVKTYTHAARPESTPGKAKVGFIKEWKITGFARDEALEYLNTMSTREGVAAHFNEIALITGNSAYNPAAGSRDLVVNVRTQENASYKPVPPEGASDSDESTYPFTFDLTITQRFDATDPLAINVAKAP